MKVENNLDTDKVRGLVWRLAFPSMLAQFVNVMYSIVDRMYIGNIPEIGALALAGVGICGPVVTLISSFASWIGVGGAPLMSIRLGQKNERAAAQMVAERPTLPPKSRRATYVAPLAKTVRKPEVVVVTGTPEQMMWLCMSMSYYSGHRFDFHASGFNSMCVEAVLYPLTEQEPNITFGCYGCRAATDVAEDMMFMGLPVDKLPIVAQGLTELAKKAIPDSRMKIYVPPIM